MRNQQYFDQMRADRDAYLKRAEAAEAEVERLRPRLKTTEEALYCYDVDDMHAMFKRAEAAEQERDAALAVVEAARVWRAWVTSRRHRFNAAELALQEALTKLDGS